MPFRRVVTGGCLLFALSMGTISRAQSGSADGGSQAEANSKAEGVTVFRSTTTLVYLDVTVLDKKGHPVVTGLSKDDFSITEDGKPQRIFSFEAPAGADDKDDGLAPAGRKDGSGDGLAADVSAQGLRTEETQIIIVLDLLNTRFKDSAFVRDQTRKFLLEQPETLPQATELMVLGNSALKVLQGSTQSRGELLAALDHLSWELPYKSDHMINFVTELVRQSYDAMQQISIENRGVGGRKNVIWIGTGPPNIQMEWLPDPQVEVMRRYVRHTVNLLVEARISLFELNQEFVVFAKPIETKDQEQSIATEAGQTLVPFSVGGNYSFAEFAPETGGQKFNENDVSMAIHKSLELGSRYYTLTYQPPAGEADGRFRRIKVKLRNPDLRLVTKEGYFSRERGELIESDNRTVDMLQDVSLAAISFPALNVRVAAVVRHPDAKTAEFTIEFQDPKLHWQAAANGKSSTTVIVSAVSRSGLDEIVDSRIAKFYLLAASQDSDELAEVKPEVKMTLPVRRAAKNVRLALATGGGERIGSVDVDRKEIDAATAAPTPQPQLRARKNGLDR
jgi:VWFA-related protein